MTDPLSSPFFRSQRLNLLRAIGVVVTVAVLHVVTAVAATPLKGDACEGSVKTSGTVKINGHEAISGQTLFSESEITTSVNAESLIQLQNSARLNLLPESDLQIGFNRLQLSGHLNQGTMVGLVPSGIALTFSTEDLSIFSEPSASVVFRIQASECAGTMLTVQQGRLLVHAPGVEQIVNAGESLSTVTTSQSSAPRATNNLTSNQKLGLWVAIGAATGIVLAVVLGQNDEDQQTPGGGCVIAPSGPGGPGQCP
jgi:hypothetical protein